MFMAPLIVRLRKREKFLALTEREKEILRLSIAGLTDYRIARKLHSYTSSVKRSRFNALRKIENAKTDLDFITQVRLKFG